MNKRSQYDKRGAFELGEQAESLFVSEGRRRGWHVTKSGDWEDMRGHLDFTIRKDRTVYTVDVKAAKRLSSREQAAQFAWVWLEIRGVKDAGWIYGGHSDLIAFQIASAFLFVQRERLKGFIAQHVQKRRVFQANKAQYSLYYRRGGERSDILTLVETARLKAEIRFGEWSYE